MIRETKRLAYPCFRTPIDIFHVGLSEHMPVELLEQINPNDYAVKFAGRIKGTLEVIRRAIPDTLMLSAVAPDNYMRTALLISFGISTA